jgi:hypothetical protein
MLYGGLSLRLVTEVGIESVTLCILTAASPGGGELGCSELTECIFILN